MRLIKSLAASGSFGLPIPFILFSQVDKKLLIPFGAEQWRFRDTEYPQAQPSTELRDPIDHFFMQCLVPPPPPLAHFTLSHLKLGLDEADDETSLFKKSEKVRKKFFDGNERGIDEDQIGCFSNLLLLEITDVSPLQVYHPGGFLKFPCQLSISHIHGINLLCPFLENTIRETSGGSPYIHHDHPLGINVKCLEGSFQFFTPSTHKKGIPSLKLKLGFTIDHRPGFINPLPSNSHFSCHDQGPCLFTALYHPFFY